MQGPDEASGSTTEIRPGAYIRPPFKVDTNGPLPLDLVPKDGRGRTRAKFFKTGAHLIDSYYALWDGYYAQYHRKAYPLVFAHDRWYIFQKTRNPETKEWEGGTATRIAPTVFRLNPELDPFEGELLRSQVIRPLEEELDLLAAQIHEAETDEEPEEVRPTSPQESDASIPEPRK
jgi:hypothetical protein